MRRNSAIQSLSSGRVSRHAQRTRPVPGLPACRPASASIAHTLPGWSLCVRRVGQTGIDWRDAALGRRKHERKTVGLGTSSMRCRRVGGTALTSATRAAQAHSTHADAHLRTMHSSASSPSSRVRLDVRCGTAASFSRGAHALGGPLPPPLSVLEDAQASAGGSTTIRVCLPGRQCSSWAGDFCMTTTPPS
jgi:hypothetical protein